jgi:hypothetical protein
MTDIPTGAPRSEDGQWWWDGAQWQPVSSPTAGAETGAVATAPATAGQVSDDGQWRWDGTAWQPAHAEAAVPAAGIPNVTVSATADQTTATSANATVIVVGVTVKNEGETSIEAGRLNVSIMATSSDGATEGSAHLDGNLGYELAPGHDRLIDLPLQVDPGSWTVWVDISDTRSDNALVARSPEVAVHVEGQETTRRSFDDTHAIALTVRITTVEHIEGDLFRVHYDLQNDSDRELPAGMTVHGDLVGAMSSDQLYQLTVPLPARHSHANYLTLETHRPSHVRATITVDPGGPSQSEDSAEVEIAADGTATMSR